MGEIINIGGRAMGHMEVRVAGKPMRAPLMTVLLLLALLLSSIYCFGMALAWGEVGLREAFLALSMEGLFFIIVVTLCALNKRLFIFDPFVFVLILHILLFYAAPIFQFSSGQTDRYGVEVAPYCLEGTALVMLGITVFFLSNQIKLGESRKSKTSFYHEPPVSCKLLLYRVSLGLWICAYVISVFYYLRRGYGLAFILTGGFGSGVSDSVLSEDSLAFLAYFKLVLVSTWLVICVYGNNTAIKILLLLGTAAIMMLSGGRAAMLIVILAPIVYFYAGKQENPNSLAVLIGLALLIALFAIMQVTRVGVRSGAAFDLSNLSFDKLFSPFVAEIDDFKSFYALLPIFPEKRDFLFGSQMIVYSLVLLIPRRIWPGKPSPQIYDIVLQSLGPQAVLNGNSYPAIGEYFVEFGIAGVIGCYFLLGIACRKMRRMSLRASQGSLALISYSLFYSVLLNLVLRGYFPQNFTTLLFIFAPIALLSFISKRQLKIECSRNNLEK